MYKSNGSAILDIIVILGVSLLIYSWIYNDMAINSDNTSKLKYYMDDTKGTVIEDVFNRKLKLVFDDGKITNGEFHQIEENYNGFKLSALTNAENQYVKKISQEVLQEETKNIKAEAEAEAEELSYVYVILFSVLGFIILLGCLYTFRY